MVEEQREPVPRNDHDELDTALAFLRFARHCLTKKAAGLSEEQVRRVLVPSGTSILGMIQHMTVGERYWFGHHVQGIGSEDDYDFTMVVPDVVTAEQVIEEYERAIADSDAAIVAVGDLTTCVVEPIDGELLSLRWVIAHVTTETTRHAGHADILRELIDGTTGR